MRPLSAYKKLKITYSELDNAMKAMGFQSKVQKSEDEVKERLLGRPRFFIVYSDPASSGMLHALIQRPEVELVKLYDIFHITEELYIYEYIKDYDDLAKMVVKNRLAERKATATA